jgi:putative transcriptional regulator
MTLVAGPWVAPGGAPDVDVVAAPAPRVHPSEETLVAAVSGQLDRPQRVVILSHVELCRDCAKLQAELATAGGELLAGLEVTERPSPELWRRIESALDTPPPADELDASLPLPALVRAELRGTPAPQWRTQLLKGGRMALLDEDAVSGAQLWLGEMPGGLRFPRHLHLGTEQVTVLAGGYEDERGSFEAGDYVEYERGSEHGPDTLDGERCWILFRLEGTVRFRGWRGLLQRLFA